MKVYDKRELAKLLNVGLPKAYEIMKQYGFQIGNTVKSSYRITEEGVQKWVEQQRTQRTTQNDTAPSR